MLNVGMIVGVSVAVGSGVVVGKAVGVAVSIGVCVFAGYWGALQVTWVMTAVTTAGRPFSGGHRRVTATQLKLLRISIR